MEIQGFFDPRSYTLTYVVHDRETRDALVIDPVMDYEPASSRTFTESVNRVIASIQDKKLKLHYVLETHAHADHLSGSQLIKQACPRVKIAIGNRIREVQQMFKPIFNLPPGFPTDGRQFDRLLADGEKLMAGSLEVQVMNTPGHTPACVTYNIGDALFTGDLLFMPDAGTGRCDFPGGSSQEMYRSITARIYTRPDEARTFTGHDYQPGGREVAWQSTVGEHRRSNVALKEGTSEQAFVSFRDDRDRTLSAPKLLFHSVQVNIAAGRLPEPQENQIRYLKVPLNFFRPDEVVDPDKVEYMKVDKLCCGE